MVQLIDQSNLFPGSQAEPRRRSLLFPVVVTALILFLFTLQFVPNLAYQLNYSFANALGLQPMAFTGPAGAPGNAGIAGADGLPGSLGPAGPAGPAGLNGADGSDGADGADGADGSDGADGADGADGSDGADGAGGLDNGAGVVSLGACDASVEIRMTSRIDIDSRIFYVDGVILSDIADACHGQSLSIWIYGAADTELAEARGLTIPDAATMTIGSEKFTPSAIVAADPTSVNEEAANLVLTIE